MRIFGFDIIRRKNASDAISIDQVMQRLNAWYTTISGILVTPETCMESPTMQAIIQGVGRRIAISPVHVYRKTRSAGRDAKELLPNHPVARLLAYPNEWQSRVNYWEDAVSWRIRYGNYFAYKDRGNTGPILNLMPFIPSSMSVTRNPDWSLTYRGTLAGGESRDFSSREIHHVRGPARNGYLGDSPVWDIREAIALEIAAERHGATFFGNGALPLMIFKPAANFSGFKDDKDQKRFIEDVSSALSGNKKHGGLFLPKGVERDKDPVMQNDQAQFLETRKLQRSIIAGAVGVPPHLVGDLERAHFSNVEQQDQNFINNVVLPFAQEFESAMERDLLTDQDRARGVIIRFNLDAVQRADFKSRTEAFKIQRDAGVICVDEWREHENMNPLPAGKGGEDYLRPLNMAVAGAAPEPAPPPADPQQDPEDPTDPQAKSFWQDLRDRRLESEAGSNVTSMNGWRQRLMRRAG